MNMWFLEVGAVLGMLLGGALCYDNDNKETKKIGEILFSVGLICLIIYICVMAGNK
jgi:sugar phosphate permease